MPLATLATSLLCVGLVARAPHLRGTTARGAPPAARMSAVDELLELVNADKDSRTAATRAQIVALSDELAASQQGEALLTDPSFVGNYSVAFFDSSVDGGRDGRRTGSRDDNSEEGWPKRLRRSVLRRTFRQRGSFQHVISPTELVNFVCFTFFGLLRGSVVARGQDIP